MLEKELSNSDMADIKMEGDCYIFVLETTGKLGLRENDLFVGLEMIYSVIRCRIRKGWSLL